MQRRYSGDWKEELRSRADIASVVAEYVQLKPGGRDLWGLCPFHNEKTASFKVSPDMGLYHCFGCKAGGDVIDFIMGIERMSFMEAVRHLADKVNMPLPDMSEQDRTAAKQRRSRRDKILELNRRAARFFHETLYRPEGARALSYLHGRGLDDKTIRVFGLGASPAEWDALCRMFLAEGETAGDLIAAGLAVSKDQKKPFDMFRDRAIFPIIAEHGAVLGFGARALGDAQPKYLNTSDTEAFSKREHVYAANLLKSLRHLPRIILVEGYMDVVALTHRGIQGVVATLGTALTPEQAKYLSRKAPEIWIAYDGDSAGKRAVLRALDVFEASDTPVRALSFPGGMDPDDFIRKHGVEAFQALTPLSAPVFRMQYAMEGLDLSTERGRTEYAIRAAAIIRAVKQPVEAENLLKKLGLETGFPREVLLQQVGITAPVEKAYSAPARHSRPPREAVRFTPDHVRAEQMLLALLAHGRIPAGMVPADAFADGHRRQLAEGLLSGQSPASLAGMLDGEPRQEFLAVISAAVPDNDEEAMEVVTECMETMQKGSINAKIEMLTKRLGEAALEEKPDILRQIQQLTAMRDM